MIEPEVPWTVSSHVPTVAVGCVVMVRTVLALGVTGFVSKVAFVPAGRPDTLNRTDEVNPFVAVS